jgi:hypothetical protein
MRYSLDQFEPGEAWLVFRVDCLVQDQAVDIYLLIDVASTYVFGNIIVPGELLKNSEITNLMRDAYKTKKAWPKTLFRPAQDPAENLFRHHAKEKGISFVVKPLTYFERIIGPLKKLFGQKFPSPILTWL